MYESPLLLTIVTFYFKLPHIYDANGNQLTRFTSILRTSSDPVSIVIFAAGGGHASRRPRSEVTTYNVFGQITRIVNTHYTVEYAYRVNGLRLSKTVAVGGYAAAKPQHIFGIAQALL